MNFHPSSLRKSAAPSAKALAACLLAAILAGCIGGGRPSAPAPIVTPNAEPGHQTEPQPLFSAPAPAARGGALTPAFLAGKPIVRIGVLLPFSTSPAEAKSLYDAAEMSLFDHGDGTTLLLPRDSGPDETSAGAAARALLAAGADVIVGPISKAQVGAVASATRAARVPVVAFSTDATVAGGGVYLLTYPFEEEIYRIVNYAAAQGVKRFAILAPDIEYGRRVDAAFRQEIARRGGAVVAGAFYKRTDNDAAQAAKAIIAQAHAGGAQALLLPDNGSPLRTIGQTLLQASFDTKHTKLLGTSLWSADAHHEPSLQGGWFAAPDPALQTAFDARYRATFAHAPTRLAGLAYDAVAVSETLARGGNSAGVNPAALQQRDGFIGADGVFRFLPSGTVQRGLAVLEVHPGAPTIADPAPTTLADRGS